MNIILQLKKIIGSKSYIAKFSEYGKGFYKDLLRIIIIDSITPLIGIISILIFKEAIDFAIEANSTKAIIYLCVYAIASIITTILRALVGYKRNLSGEKLRNHLQRKFIQSYYSMNWRQTINIHTGDIVTRLTKDLGSIVQFYINTVPSIIALLLEFIVAFIIVLQFDAKLGIVVMFLAPLVILGSTLLGRKIKPIQNKLNNKEGDYRSLLNESIQNSIIVKTFQNQSRISKLLQDLQESKFLLYSKQTKTIVLANFIVQLGFSLTTIIVFIWGTIQISKGIITFGVFLALIQLMSRIQNPIFRLSKLLPQYINVLSAIDRCEDFLVEIPLYRIPEKITNDKYGINIKNITFGYTVENPIISNFSEIIKPGEKVAIIGSSGIGKTTLLRLIMNMFEPSNGEIYTECKTSIHPNREEFYTYVPQGNTLFSGSVKSNLMFGNPYASEEEMYHALEVACAKSFISSLPEGLNSSLGERGTGLSEGQLQRICIARALLRESPILLLDEATSALDIETEEAVIYNISSKFPNKTLIAITHRPSILTIVDRTITIT